MNTAHTIQVTLDGLPHSLPAGTTLAQWVTQLGHLPASVTSAVNGVFVPRGQRNEKVLSHGDAVLLFRPIVGG